MIDIRRRARLALADPQLQRNLDRTLGLTLRARSQAVAEVPNWEALRAYAREVKAHTLARLGVYLEELETRVVEQGSRVVWAETAADAVAQVIEIATRAGARKVVKGKSMLAEEVDLNRALERNGIRPLETDLGEFIVQLAGERPSHITAPALHKSRGQIASLFVERLGMPPTEDVEQITAQAREVLRRDFLTAPVGVTGVNFGVAQTGTLVVVENEGNARLSLSLPKIHVALMGIEKVVPRVHDLAVFLKLLGRSTTGQRMTSYVNLLNGPLRADESDGPAELHLVLVDNGRSRILEDRFLRQTLCCIRCGACLNICPVFQRIGGHAYGGVYPGPIGAILSPQLLSTDAAPQHAFVSSLCGACREICPVKIEIPRILLQLREQTQKGKNAKAVRVPVEKAAMQLWARATATPRAYRAAGRALKWLWRLPIPPVRKWSRKREPPSIPMLPFRDLFSAQETSIHDHGSDNVLVNDKGLDGQ